NTLPPDSNSAASVAAPAPAGGVTLNVALNSSSLPFNAAGTSAGEADQPDGNFKRSVPAVSAATLLFNVTRTCLGCRSGKTSVFSSTPTATSGTTTTGRYRSPRTR